ncbi:MAG: anthranilate synthase component I family protein [Bacteroidetes bacterium]|nr:anthranilate synthase component I family protein [Bacteroidota bacterium]
MRNKVEVKIADGNNFKRKLLSFSRNLKRFVLLDSNSFNQKNTNFTYYKYDFLCAINAKNELLVTDYKAFSKLNDFNKLNPEWRFGFLTYDLKNEVEELTSNNKDHLDFPTIHFFIPEIVIHAINNLVTILYFEDDYSEKEVYNLLEKIEKSDLTDENYKKEQIKLNQRFNKKEYIHTVNKLKDHIQKGDIYEINFCHEFYSQNSIDPVRTFDQLNKISPTPFSCFYKIDDKYLLSASPERFLKKINQKIVSQPIKGTIKRDPDKEKDNILKEKLFNDPKERAENVMIVDLVRNDLSRTAKKGSVQVEELYGIYSFSQVHQMISTVTSGVEKDKNIVEIIKNAYPMGSMTGAPKVRAMTLIEQYEKTKRGLYSGSVGFITPENDFDFNVVIRSILYNESKKYVSFTVGGAITSLCDPENEYEESLLKAAAILKVFN